MDDPRKRLKLLQPNVGPPAFGFEAAAFDVTSEGAVRNGVARILSQVGSLDVVILNAGTGVRGPVADMSYDDWKRVLSLNLDGAFPCGP